MAFVLSNNAIFSKIFTPIFFKTFVRFFSEMTNLQIIIFAFAFNAKSFVIAILVLFFFFSFSSLFSERTSKSFLANVLSLVIKKTCDQDLTHSLDTPKYIFLKIVPEVVVHDAYDTYYYTLF